MKRRRTRGAALLAAMLTVTLVATVASAALWQQWRGAEIESAERTRVQAAWVLTGALDWARLILREDLRAGGAVDHLAEPWAVPLEEARLSTFLAADRSTGTDPGAEEAFLSGRIVDRHSLLNVSNLFEAGRIHEGSYRSFRRLFELLGLPQQELQRLAENLRFAADIHVDNRSSGRAALMPQQVSQLVWLGLAPATVAALEPYVTILPARTAVNLNTAPAEVIYAVGRGFGLAEAQRLVAQRDRSHFRSAADAARLLPQPEGAFGDDLAGVSSSYFEVRGRLRIGGAVVEQRSLVVRGGPTVQGAREVRTLWREHVAPAAGTPEAAAHRR